MAEDFKSPGTLLDLVGEIYDCAIEPGKWPGALKRIAHAIDGANAAISLANMQDNNVLLRTHWNVDSSFEEGMLANFAINPLVTAVWYHDVDEPYSAYEAMGEEALKNTNWHRQAVAPYGLGDAIATLLAKTPAQFGSLSLFRDTRKPAFGDKEKATLKALAPHVRRAVMITEMLDARALERDMLAATLDRLAVGVVLTDGADRIVHANDAAARYIGDGDVLRRVDQQLVAVEPSSARELAHAIAEAASGTTVNIPRSGIGLALRGSSGRDLAAWVLPLDRGLRRELGPKLTACTAIFIREIGDTTPFPAELFARRYAITPAESRVLMLLMQGMSLADAADNLGIAMPTAKTHLAHLFRKTGTSRQTDLIRLAMSALAPVT